MRGQFLLAVCFAAIVAHVVGLAHFTPAWQHLEVLLPLWLVAGVGWCGTLWIAQQGKLSLALVVPGAILLRVVALTSWPELSDDVFRYVWEGELITRGVSPFAYAPDDVSLAHIARELSDVHGRVNHPSVSAAYPPVTQAACALVMAVEHQLAIGAVWLMRLFFCACDLLVLWPLALLLRKAGKPMGLAVAWAWSPLVVAEFAGSGHFDSLGVLLLLGALVLLTAKFPVRRGSGQLLLAAAILVKYLPVLALPFALRGRASFKRALGVLLLVVLGFLPLVFLEGGARGLFDGLGNYGLRWQSFGLVHPTLAQLFDGVFQQDGGWFDSRRLVRLTLAGSLLAVGLWAWRKRLEPTQATGLLLGVFLVLSPTLHPWYVTWIVPFIPLALRPAGELWTRPTSTLPWIWLVVTIPLTYAVLPGWKRDGVWELSPWIQGSIALPVLMLLFFAARSAVIESREP